MAIAAGEWLAAASQSSKPARRSTANAAIKAALKMLVEEAQAALRQQRLPQSTPDFASRFESAIPRDDLLAALTQPAHRDSFIDAYIRWQLTSFDPELPELDDRQMLKLMANAPAFGVNPRSDNQLVANFRKAEKADRLTRSELNQLREMSEGLERRTKIAEALNQPAEAYRNWVASKMGETGPRPLQWQIEGCAATVKAGWPTRNVKARMTKAFKAAARDSSLSPRQRILISEQARTLIGLKRVAINEITFLADGSVNVSFTNAAVDKDDVEKWLAHLNNQ